VRVLIVTHYFPEHGSGIEIAAHQLARRLASRGFALEWIASRNSGGMASDAEGARPEPAWNVAERTLGVPYPFWSPLAFSRLLKAMSRCDVLHLHDTLYMGNVLAFAAARLAKKPVLVTQHVGLVPYRNRALAAMMQTANRLLAARLLKRSAATVFYSRTTQKYFSRLLGADFAAAWIANGVDASFHPVDEAERQRIRAEVGWPRESQVMLFAGRFVEKKGIHIIRHLAERFPHCLWVMAGTGPGNPAGWHLPNVRVMGQRTHGSMMRVYQAADLLVLPSVGEGFPLVVQESMACGTPVAVSSETAAAHPGVADIVWSTEPDPKAFEILIRSISSSPDVLHARRGAVADFARREWNWDVCADSYAHLLRGLTAASRRQPQSTKIPPTTAL